jgi:hypothetical protein
MEFLWKTIYYDRKGHSEMDEIDARKSANTVWKKYL